MAIAAIINGDEARIRDADMGDILVERQPDGSFFIDYDGEDCFDFPGMDLSEEVAETLHEVLGLLLERGRL